MLFSYKSNQIPYHSWQMNIRFNLNYELKILDLEFSIFSDQLGFIHERFFVVKFLNHLVW